MHNFIRIESKFVPLAKQNTIFTSTIYLLFNSILILIIIIIKLLTKQKNKQKVIIP